MEASQCSPWAFCFIIRALVRGGNVEGALQWIAEAPRRANGKLSRELRKEILEVCREQGAGRGRMEEMVIRTLSGFNGAGSGTSSSPPQPSHKPSARDQHRDRPADCVAAAARLGLLVTDSSSAVAPNAASAKLGMTQIVELAPASSARKASSYGAIERPRAAAELFNWPQPPTSPSVWPALTAEEEAVVDSATLSPFVSEPLIL